MKHFNKVRTVVLCVFLFSLGCAKMDTAGTQPPASPNPKGKRPPISESTVCYSGVCYATVPKAGLIDPKKDYDYPDPATFPRKEQRKQYAAPIHFLDLKNLNLNENVAAHFKLGDFLSLSKGRYGLYSPAVVQKLESIRNELRLPVMITSAYRSPGYNKRTDGSANWSRHTYGDAADFKVNGKAPKELAQYCTNQNSSFYLVYKTHIHCDWRNEPLDPNFFGTSNKQESQDTANALEANVLKAESESRFVFTEDEDYHYLTIEVPHESEEGELIYEWLITLPNGEVIASDLQQVQIPKVSGAVHVSALVGGVLQFEEDFVW